MSKSYQFSKPGPGLLSNISKAELAEWRSGIVSALPCERPGFVPRIRLREIIPANNCTMQGQNNWGNWGSPVVMKLWGACDVLRWLMNFRELCSGGFHPKLVTPPYHGFLVWTLPQIVKIQNGTKCNAKTQVPVGSIIIGLSSSWGRHRRKTNAYSAHYYYK